MSVEFQPAIPVFCIFDEAKAREFYLGWLGMTMDWEHRFKEGAPIYCQVSRGPVKFHLSGHSGEASPAATALVYMHGVEEWHNELMNKPHTHGRPGLQHEEWGIECTVVDPFGNEIRFLQAKR